MTGDPKLDAVLTFLVAPFVASVIGLIAAAVLVAEWWDRRQDFTPSPEVEAARRDLRAKAWGGEVE